MHSLTAWLARHGRHVRQLECAFPKGEGPDYPAAIAACLVAAGLAGGLQTLTISGFLPNTEWLAAMRSLRELHTTCLAGPLRLCPAINKLTALRRLRLGTPALELTAGSRLPPSVTSLHLVEHHSEVMPELVSKAAGCARMTGCSEHAAMLTTLAREFSTSPSLQLCFLCVSAGRAAAPSGGLGTCRLRLFSSQHGAAVTPEQQPDAARNCKQPLACRRTDAYTAAAPESVGVPIGWRLASFGRRAAAPAAANTPGELPRPPGWLRNGYLRT